VLKKKMQRDGVFREMKLFFDAVCLEAHLIACAPDHAAVATVVGEQDWGFRSKWLASSHCQSYQSRTAGSSHCDLTKDPPEELSQFQTLFVGSSQTETPLLS
jgi:hypothetical protein